MLTLLRKCKVEVKGGLVIKTQKKVLIVGLCIIVALFVGVLLTNTQQEKHETVKEMMRDAVLHEVNRINFFGIMDVNPGFISAVVVTILLLTTAAIFRVFVVPKFKYVPISKTQIALEQLVGFFADFAKTNSPHKNAFLGAYIFGAGMYIFFGTLFELLGFQAITTMGHSISLPAPLSDINGAIAQGCLSYIVVVAGGIVVNGFRGLLSALKEFSMPLSMSFRLFGAMLGGVLVTELVYYYIHLSFLLPIVVAVLFTLLHAVIQTYVLIMLTSSAFGSATALSGK